MKFKRRYKIKAIALKKEVLVPFVEELEAPMSLIAQLVFNLTSKVDGGVYT